ncbi:MAG: hypothetical protein HKM05_06750 [Spirochaetales bacterium]|nr:hypothetical protein [Spirochaetales bacterium]
MRLPRFLTNSLLVLGPESGFIEPVLFFLQSDEKRLCTATGYGIEAKIPLRRLARKRFFARQAFRAEFQIRYGNTGKPENLLDGSLPHDNPCYGASVWGNGMVQALSENVNE